MKGRSAGGVLVLIVSATFLGIVGPLLDFNFKLFELLRR